MSYVRLEGNDVVETAEKKVISNHASSGLYYFRKACDFRRIYRGSEFSGESYVAPLYNELIKSEAKVGIWHHKSVTPLGTTEELEAFVSSAKPELIEAVSKNRD
jgi:hypothetical protein